MYWKKQGKACTADTINLAVETARERGIKKIVVASISGYTAQQLVDKGLEVICVTHANGFKNPGENEMSMEARTDLEAKGVKIFTGTHLLSGAERALSTGFGGIYPVETIAGALRMFGQGVKVCVEISAMAMDAGLLPYGEHIIAIGGTGYGADTAVILKPAHGKEILNTRIEEIICMP